MRICLCDDDIKQLEYLQYLINLWQNNSHEICEIAIYHSSEELLFENENNFPFDIMILDIQMGNINGINLAKRIREFDRKVFIVFLSGISDYVFEGYEVSAMRYLLKPLKPELLYQILEKVKTSLRNEKKYIILSNNGTKEKIEHQEILFIESFGHYITLYTENKQYDIKKGIKEIYEEVKDSSFIISHRSYIVNLEFIDRITKTDCILNNGRKVPISRDSYKDVNEQFIKYYKSEEK